MNAIPNVGAVYDRPQFGGMQTYQLWAVYEAVKKLGTDPEIVKRLLQRLNLEFDFGVRPHFFTASMTAHNFEGCTPTDCGRS